MSGLTIRQIAEEFTITLRTLRFWEAKGLLAPGRAAQERIYSDRDRGTLAKIVHWRQQQFTVEEIKSALARGGFSQDELRAQRDFLMQTRLEVEKAIIDIDSELIRICPNSRRAAHIPYDCLGATKAASQIPARAAQLRKG